MNLTSEQLKGKLTIEFENLMLDGHKATMVCEAHIKGDIYIMAQNISEIMLVREKLAELILLSCEAYLQKKEERK